MTEQEIEAKLKNALTRLNRAADQVAQTNGYTSEVRKLRLLAELIKEQLKSEYTDHSTRPIR